MVAPTEGQGQRLAQAAIAKATRLLMLPEAPFGSWGDLTELGMAQVRPDHAIGEMLYGLHFRDLEIADWGALVTADDVIRAGLQAEPDDLAPDRVADVERALGAAIDWIEEELAEGIGFA